jgi:peptidoglycan hydrolase-like protein with peptidoglycan-binding domain
MAAGRLSSLRLPRPGRRLLAGVTLLLVAAGVAVAVTDPFTGSAPAASGASDNGTATTLQAVTRQSLTSQIQVDGTLGYADSSTVSLPAGTSPSSLRQVEQAVVAARQALASALATRADDGRALTQAQSRLAADRLKEQSDCAGANAAQSTVAGTAGSGGAAPPCASAAQAVAADEAAVATAGQKLTGDRGQVASAQTSLTGAEQTLAAAQSSAVVYDSGAAYTMLPEAGAVIRRGQPIYAIDGEPTVLMYGSVAAWRAFRPGMAPGGDVAQLNRNLDALGFGHRLAGARFTAATRQAVTAFQAAHGLEQTGALLLGAVAFSPGAVRVTSVTPTLGQPVQTGGGQGQSGSAVLSVTSTRHQVAIQLDAAHQSQIKVGDRVVVTLPDNSTTPAVVSKVGKVATVPSGDQGSGGSSTPTVEVDVRLLHEAAAGSLDQAPVSVSIIAGSVDNVLAVPVNALLALAGGGYAVEVAGAGGARRLAAVTLGLFDDADGLVQVSGSSLRAGQRVVVPAS